MSADHPTPADLRHLAATADVLAEQIDALHAALLAEEPGARRRAGARLHEAAGSTRRASRDLEATAGELARIASTPDQACGIEWGVCPEHGNTLVSDGDRTVCKVQDCPRRWGYDRVSTPCPEPVTHRITDTGGATHDVCDGHAASARHRITGASVEPIT